MTFFFIFNIETAYTQYSFFVAGHTYGQPGVDNEGFHPPFKEKFEYIQSREEIVFGVLTGDIVKPNPIAQDWEEIDADIEGLGLPVYFAVGNHDMENRPLFESRYGDTYYYFIYQNDLFIVLDPNIDGWNISGDQLFFLQDAVAVNYQSVDNIFVFFHQMLWWESDNIYHSIFPNSFAGRDDEINFWTVIEPLFNNLPNNVILFAGDFGAASWSDNLMYDNYDNITFIGSGMGEGPYNGDNFVIANIGVDKSITYDLICLNENFYCLGELVDFDLEKSELGNNIAINIYPNPTNKILNIECTENYIQKIILCDITGKQIIEKIKIKQNETINLSSLKSGIYIISIQSDNELFTSKIVKE